MQCLRIATSFLFVLATATAFAQSDAKSTFEHLNTLQGTWEGKSPDGKTVQVVFRQTSGGSALLSEIMGEYNMITMFHMDKDRVLMTHYCAAGNQPRMQASASPDGKTITFNFIDATNLSSPKVGHMQRLVLTLADADHHVQEWTFTQDGKETKEHFELARVKPAM